MKYCTEHILLPPLETELSSQGRFHKSDIAETRYYCSCLWLSTRFTGIPGRTLHKTAYTSRITRQGAHPFILYIVNQKVAPSSFLWGGGDKVGLCLDGYNVRVSRPAFSFHCPDVKALRRPCK